MKNLKHNLYDIVFESDTRKGKNFDLALIITIIASIIVVILESVPALRQNYGAWFKISEWIITIIFTIEYILRIFIVEKPIKYIFSFYGIIDFLSVIPTYLALFVLGVHSLIVIRALRLLRIFRILKITRFINETSILKKAILASRVKISIFLFTVTTIVIIIGTLMYLVEGEQSGFTSIPKSIYWAVVTLTTVGYGDITPQTPLGQFISGVVMILGYAIIAVPTGIVTVELSNTMRKKPDNRVCQGCFSEEHDTDAQFCKKCGHELEN